MKSLSFVKLYEIPRKSKIYLMDGVNSPDDSTYVTFYKLDGAYSYCETEKGNIVHLSANTELEPHLDGYKFKL